MKKINVMLYGGFSGNDRNRAEIITCDKCDNCSFYEKGSCLNVTTLFSRRCQFGNIQMIYGYTKRAKSRTSFDAKYRTDECYGKLHYPNDWRVAVMDDTVALNLIYAICDKKIWTGSEWKTLENYKVRDCGCSTGKISYIPLEFLTSDLLYKILSYEPYTVFDHKVNKDYQNNIIPNLLCELKKLLPDKYNELIKEYPKYKDVAPNFVGKIALIKTMPDGVVLKDGTKGSFIKKEDYLISNKWNSSFLPFGGVDAEIKIKITDKMTYKITDNSEVDEKTVFI